MENLDDSDIAALQDALDALPVPLEPLDLSALDGFLCGVILQPHPVPAAQWQRHALDVEGRAPPAGADTRTALALIERRHAELQHAIDARAWFDPWVFDVDGQGDPSPALLPWVAGFASAQDLFPALMAMDNAELVEPLALLYLHFDRDDLEDADALLAVIDTLEPPADLAEAVQDLVRALMLIADTTRPRRRQTAALRPRRHRR
jgi:uncharacterized protein